MWSGSYVDILKWKNEYEGDDVEEQMTTRFMDMKPARIHQAAILGLSQLGLLFEDSAILTDYTMPCFYVSAEEYDRDDFYSRLYEDGMDAWLETNRHLLEFAVK
eukprot:GFYU01020966.1.p1 GENE.GFYU01020966.1~~GFYU01020966.1.p1  ORF type:complete len:104 (-),score=7.57 GFYU01020966.1:2-313(-)